MKSKRFLTRAKEYCSTLQGLGLRLRNHLWVQMRLLISFLVFEIEVLQN